MAAPGARVARGLSAGISCRASAALAARLLPRHVQLGRCASGAVSAAAAARPAFGLAGHAAAPTHVPILNGALAWRGERWTLDWLWANAPAHFDPVTNQRTLQPLDACAVPHAAEARTSPDGGLEVDWRLDAAVLPLHLPPASTAPAAAPATLPPAVAHVLSSPFGRLASAPAGLGPAHTDSAAVTVTLTYPAEWLAAQAHSDAALVAAEAAAAPVALSSRVPAAGTAPGLHQPQLQAPGAAAAALVPRFAHDALLAPGDTGERAVLACLSAVNEHGLAIVSGCPTNSETDVVRLAERISPAMATIYGTHWAVEAVSSPINAAYTSSYLAMHQDLVYLESPPGLQLLLCRAFDTSVAGGESTFVDALDAGEQLRARDPDAFATLARVPGTFQKVHYARDRPVHMVTQRTVFATSRAWQPDGAVAAAAESGGGCAAANAAMLGPLTGVFWAPPFEGPLRVPHRDVAPYYRAYAAFAQLLAEMERGARPGLIQFRLAPGECVVFNNRRMLHGRRAFSGSAGRRLLQGCYVNADDWKSRLATLRTRFGAGGEEQGDGGSGGWAPSPGRPCPLASPPGVRRIGNQGLT